MLSEETLKKYFDAVILSKWSPGEMGSLWKDFLLHKDILDEAVAKIKEEAYSDGHEDATMQYYS